MPELKTKVLAVDDIEACLDEVREALQLDAEVTCAPAGKQALNCIRANVGEPFKLILLDFHMPEMNGLEVLEEIRTIKGYEKTAVVLLTTATNPDLMKRATQLGAIAWIVKPPSARALKLLVKQVQIDAN